MVGEESGITSHLHPAAEAVDRIILTGFRGTGKSAVGRQLAQMLGYRFVDTDQVLAEEMRCSVSEFVQREGWPAFRDIERRLLKRLAAEHRAVIATGGGTVLHREEWQNLHRGSLVVWLQADAATIRYRLRNDERTGAQRPALIGDDPLGEVDRVLAEREPLYSQGSDVAVDTAGRSPEELAIEIWELLPHSRME